MERLSLPVTGKKFLRIRAQKTIGKTDHKNGVATLSVCKTDKASIWLFSPKNAKKSAKITLLNATNFKLSKKRILNSL
ncbi:hypothetical protein ACCC92_23835 [Mucilaginibacter sp. Mucisp84]